MGEPTIEARLAAVPELVFRRAVLVLAEPATTVRDAIRAALPLVSYALARANDDAALAHTLAARIEEAATSTAQVASLVTWALDAPEPDAATAAGRGDGVAPRLFGARLEGAVIAVRDASGADGDAARRIVEALAVGFVATLREDLRAGRMTAGLTDMTFPTPASTSADALAGAADADAVFATGAASGARTDRVASTIAGAFEHRPEATRAPATGDRTGAARAAPRSRAAETRRPSMRRTTSGFVLSLWIGIGTGLLVFGVWPKSDRGADAAVEPAAAAVARAPGDDAPPPPAAPGETPLAEHASPGTDAGVHRTVLFVGRDQTTAMRMANELAHVGRDAPSHATVEVRDTPSAVEALLAARPVGAGVAAILRYDTLDRARQPRASMGEAGKAQGTSLRVVAPLFTEEVHLVVRRDSPLGHVHDIRDRRIATGLAGSETEITVAALYDRLFDAALPASTRAFATASAAIDALLRDSTIDVVALVDGRPAAALAALDEATRARLRLLSLDPDHPTTRRATRAYLPAVIDRATYPGWLDADVATLAVMSFLVTSSRQDAAGREAVLALPALLCPGLPALRQVGHPKWGELQPGTTLPTGIPPFDGAGAAFATFTACAAPSLSASPARQAAERTRFTMR